MEAMGRMDVPVRFEIFTRVPLWFFRQSLTCSFGYHRLETDLGLVQRTPFDVDLAETLRRLNEMLPFDVRLIEALSRQMNELNCELILCDIAPLGIAVAARADLPSVLIENFTWDWIYEGYIAEDARIKAHADYLRTIFQRADYHIQTEPACAPGTRAALRTPPVSREPRTPGHVTRERLGVPHKTPCVLITMGGIPDEFTFIERLEHAGHLFFVIPGGSQTEVRHGNVLLLPQASDFYHPDLVKASEAVVGKIGYSTVAEAFHAGALFCYVMRRGFRESQVLAKFADEQMKGRAVSQEDFARASWLPLVEEMLEVSSHNSSRPNGAPDVAEFIVKLLKA